MKNFKHLMLDIETMGTKSYSAIVSIAAVEFDLETGLTGNEFYEKVNLKSSVDNGLKINPDTVLWWLNQSKEAQKELKLGEGSSLDYVLDLFMIFCNKDYQIWGNSNRFDCGILTNAYEKCNLEIPWDFRKERDVRTLVSIYPKIKKNYKFKGVAHNALDDCYHQIGYCSEIWRKIHKK